MALLNFRYSFLDAQNGAEFFKAGKSLVSEFRNLQMKEKGTSYETIIMKTLIKKIGESDTGKNWGDIYQE